jgi:magnesium transporter
LNSEKPSRPTDSEAAPKKSEESVKRRRRKGLIKPGLPPGTLIHVGERKTERPKITALRYSEDDLSIKVMDGAAECRASMGSKGVLWVNVDGLHDLQLIQSFGEQFGIHPLVLEDICNTTQRPKVEDYGEYLYVVLKMVDYDEARQAIDIEQVSLILMDKCVLTFQEKPGDVFDPVRERLRLSKGLIRKAGADYLAYALLDSVVDRYFLLLEKISDEIEALEEEILETAGGKSIQKLNALKRDMIFLRKTAWPLREILSGLERGKSSLIASDTSIYLRDLYDHAIQIIDSVETLRDILSGMLDIYLSSVSNRMNEVMKVLTIIATVFIPLTFIAGIYGMNFAYMPELEIPWAYPVVLGVMGGIAGAMVLYFRKKKWL